MVVVVTGAGEASAGGRRRLDAGCDMMVTARLTSVVVSVRASPIGGGV